MTANPRRRKQASRIALAGLVVGVIAIAVLSVVAISTLRSSEEGTDVSPPERPSQRFPSTPAAILAVTSGDRLTSLVAAVLDPSGQGGTLVTVPVNIDTTSGFGDERTPLARRAFEVGDAIALDDELAPMLGIAPSFTAVVDDAGLAELLGDPEPLVVALDDDVVDARDGDPTVVLESGERRIEVAGAIGGLTSVPPAELPAYDTHDDDVAIWTGLAEAWSLTNDPLELDRDEVGTPVEPASLNELMLRLRAGRVAVRDLAIDTNAAITLDNPTGADYVAIDTRDSILVFASIAPERVLTPNPTLTFSIIAPFSRSQLATVGEGTTTSELTRNLIGELAFLEANVVFVDTAPAEDGAETETVVLADDEAFVESASLPSLIGPSSSRVAARETDGSDVTLVLGTDFLDHRASLIAEREAERSDDDGAADFDVSSASDDGVETETETETETATAGDTVEADE